MFKIIDKIAGEIIESENYGAIQDRLFDMLDEYQDCVICEKELGKVFEVGRAR